VLWFVYHSDDQGLAQTRVRQKVSSGIGWPAVVHAVMRRCLSLRAEVELSEPSPGPRRSLGLSCEIGPTQNSGQQKPWPLRFDIADVASEAENTREHRPDRDMPLTLKYTCDLIKKPTVIRFVVAGCVRFRRI